MKDDTGTLHVLKDVLKKEMNETLFLHLLLVQCRTRPFVVVSSTEYLHEYPFHLVIH